MPDADQYLSERAMSLEPYRDWFPGPIVASAEGLCAEVEGVLDGKDPAARQRQYLRSVFHPLRTQDAAEAVWADIAGWVSSR
jgi:CDP-Glycerol:Poly(glycerophosphate) glycerophosphotransferase